MSVIIQSITTFFENKRIKRLIDNMRYNKKHYDQYVKLQMCQDYYVQMDKDTVEYLKLLDDIPHKKAKIFLQELEDDGYLEAEIGNIMVFDAYGKRNVYLKIETEGFYYKKQFRLRPGGLFHTLFYDLFFKDIRKSIDNSYMKK